MIYTILVLVSLATVALAGYSLGKDKGIEVGRNEILVENIARVGAYDPCMDANMADMINHLVEEEERTLLTYKVVKGETNA